MKTLLTIFSALLIGLSAYSQAEFSKKTLKVDFENQTDFQHYTFKKLRLYPVRANSTFLSVSQHIGKYTPLQEALTQKKVVISEREVIDTSNRNQTRNINRHVNRRIIDRNNNVQAQQNQVQGTRYIEASVNELLIENISTDTVYIMAGEVVQGGKQDRVIAQDVVLPPNSRKIDLSVFCVEHGRWTYSSDTAKLNFTSYYGVSSMKLRKEVEKTKNQQAVWNEVERSNQKNEVSTQTGAYTAQKKSLTFDKEQKEYISFFKDKFLTEKDVVGIVVVSGDRVVGCDIFVSPVLFQRQFNVLLDSYASEAVTDGAIVNIKPVVVENYMNNLFEKEENLRKNRAITRTPRFRLSEY